MRVRVLFFLGAFVINILLCEKAFAYIDPGTGSVIFSAIGYIIATAAAFFAILFKPVKDLIKKLLRRKDSIDQNK